MNQCAGIASASAANASFTDAVTPPATACANAFVCAADAAATCAASNAAADADVCSDNARSPSAPTAASTPRTTSTNCLLSDRELANSRLHRSSGSEASVVSLPAKCDDGINTARVSINRKVAGRVPPRENTDGGVGVPHQRSRADSRLLRGFRPARKRLVKDGMTCGIVLFRMR